MPSNSADPTAAARELIAKSGLAAARQRVAELEGRDRELLGRLQRLTRQENAARAKSGGDLDLEALLDREEAGESLRDETARTMRERVANAGEVRTARQDLAAILADLEPRVRATLLAGHQERVARVTAAALDLADALADVRLSNGPVEQVLSNAGLRSLGLESLLGGVDGRLNLIDGTLPWLSEASAEWTRRGWLTGPVADRAASRARALFQAMERANQQRIDREAEGQRRAKEASLLHRRAMLLSGELQMSAGDGRPGNLSPSEAVARFDRQHSGLPRPKPQPTPTAGELVPA